MRRNSQSDKRFTFKLNPETPAITHKSLVSFKCRGKKNKKKLPTDDFSTRTLAEVNFTIVNERMDVDL